MQSKMERTGKGEWEREGAMYGEQTRHAKVLFTSILLHEYRTYFFVGRGFEHPTSLEFKWSKVVQSSNGLVIECHLNDRLN